MKLHLSKININLGFQALLLAVGLVLAGGTSAYAQRPSPEEMQKIKDAKVAHISNRLGLTAEQSEKFWPVYNEYEQAKRGINREIRKIQNDKRKEGTNDNQALQNLSEVRTLRQKELDLTQEYESKFLKVISANQLTELYKAEKSFNDMLIQQLNRGGRN